MKVWIVVLRGPFDDTIRGAYASEAEARERMAEVVMEVMTGGPEAGALEPVGVAIYAAQGASVEGVDQVEFEDAPIGGLE